MTAVVLYLTSGVEIQGIFTAHRGTKRYETTQLYRISDFTTEVYTVDASKIGMNKPSHGDKHKTHGYINHKCYWMLSMFTQFCSAAPKCCLLPGHSTNAFALLPPQ